jgi:hypothetical protein
MAEMPEAANAELAGFLEQFRLLERRGGGRPLQGVCRSCHQRQVGVADLGAFDGLDAPRQFGQVLADRHAAPDGRAGHSAVVADPVDGAHRPLLVVFLGLAELGGGLGEVQLQQVLAMPDSFQLGGELSRPPVAFRTRAEPFDGDEEVRHVGARRSDRILYYHRFGQLSPHWRGCPTMVEGSLGAIRLELAA